MIFAMKKIHDCVSLYYYVYNIKLLWYILFYRINA